MHNDTYKKKNELNSFAEQITGMVGAGNLVGHTKAALVVGVFPGLFRLSPHFFYHGETVLIAYYAMNVHLQSPLAR